MAQLHHNDLPLFFMTDAAKSEALRKFFHLYPKRKDVLCRIALKNPRLAVNILNRLVKRNPHDVSLLLILAELSLVLYDRKSFEHIMDNLVLPRFGKISDKARYFRLYSLHNLYQTDMLTASKYASQALKIYQKSDCMYEEGECYLLLAQIYRISGVCDVAFSMLKEAEKIFEELKLCAKVAETKAYFGLTELRRENFKVADEYLESAANLCLEHNLNNTLADIKNWQGLSLYLNGEIKKAQELFCEAESLTNHLPTLGFAEEMLARIAFGKHHFKKAMIYARKAAVTAQRQNHRAGIFESLYLQAEIFYMQKDYVQSRKILTQIIKEKAPPSAIYYPANAYTLLGLVEFMENNFEVARTLFKQALDLEHAQNRLKGAAYDYNNLAELSKRTGNIPEANKYLKLALNYAEKIDDKELSDYLKSKLT